MTIKTKTFDNFESYEAFYNNNDHSYNVADVVEEKKWTVADAQFTCKKSATALKRLAKATGWNWILDYIEYSELPEYFEKDVAEAVLLQYIDSDVIYVAARQYKD